jgi:FdhD protein
MMALPAPYVDAAPVAWRGGATALSHRAIPEETPIAFSYNGSSYAVMMATPLDLTDFAIGFSLAENVIDSPGDIDNLDIVAVDGGIDAQIWLKPAVAQRERARRRSVLGPTGCGLCGTESIDQALKPVRSVTSQFKVTPHQIMSAMDRLQKLQILNSKTRAVHAAGLYVKGDLTVREDAGRHNALDKVLGAAATAGTAAHEGIVLLTSRVSVELVQKTARLGAPIIAAVSAPTALAVRVAQSAGITLAAIVRSDGFEVFTFPERIVEEARADVR